MHIRDILRKVLLITKAGFTCSVRGMFELTGSGRFFKIASRK